jgi:nucleoside phosphorylase
MQVRHAATQSKPGSSSSSKFYPNITGLPDLPVIDWTAIGAEAPTLLDTPAEKMPEADVVVITWAESEWAALEHVFVSSNEAMTYAQSSTGDWNGWEKYDLDMPPAKSTDDWYYWGYYRLVQINGKSVLLFKSNTHLDWPGQPYLENLINRINEYVKPELILSIGTAGGSRLIDHIGAVNIVNSGTMYSSSRPQSDWVNYSNGYSPAWSIIDGENFNSLLFPIPATHANLETLAKQFNENYGTDYPLDELNADGLDNPTDLPVLSNLTAENTPLLTASTFVVGTTSGEYANYAVIEMDDAVIGKVCNESGTAYGFVRNISDPAQNAKLPPEAQGNWGGAVYDVFGFYTSYNGALVTWAMIAAMD